MGFKWRLGLVVALIGLTGLQTAQAEVRYELTAPDNARVSINAINQKRENNTLVLYNAEYGPSTRTNAYGVEVAAEPIAGTTNRYKITKITDVWSCQNQNNLAACGNMAIPGKGIVLSAAGSRRDALMKSFKPGAELTLNSFLTFQSHFPVSSIDPTSENNPSGRGFPGYRGGNQMLIYTPRYGQPSTGTNEFGYEVTVVGNRVVRQDGADSQIPQQPDSFVLSGHGKARQWLLQNAPIGSRIEVYDGEITSIVDRDTYLYQLDQLVEKVRSLKNTELAKTLDRQVLEMRQKAVFLDDETVSHQALALKQDITPKVWASYPKATPVSQRAIWHRPSETTVKEVRQSLDLIKQAGMNTVFLETYLHGDPIFPSQTFQKYHIPQKPVFVVSDGPKDLLQLWVDEAHQRGLSVHVWFQTFYAGNKQYDGSQGAILATHPEWANIQRSAIGQESLPPSTLEAGAYFLDPAHPQAQQFVLDLIDEIVTRYPVDGFQLDYIRYPSAFPAEKSTLSTWGYSPYARQAFQQQTGADPATLSPQEQPELWAAWCNFKTAQVDNFVKKAHDLIKTKKPALPMSVAIFPKAKEALSRKHQNWVAWANNGWVDFIAPMTLTSSLDTIAQDTQLVKQQTGLPVVTGVFGPFNGNNPSEVVDQVWSAFASGASGIALFDTAHFTPKMAEALNSGIFKTSQK